MANHVVGVQADGRNSTRRGSSVKGMAPYQAYACEDGYLVVAAPNDKLFAKLSRVLENPGWAGDPRFDSNQKRSKNLPELNALIEPLLAKHLRQRGECLISGLLDVGDLTGNPSRRCRERGLGLHLRRCR